MVIRQSLKRFVLTGHRKLYFYFPTGPKHTFDNAAIKITRISGFICAENINVVGTHVPYMLI